jgi:O-antigen/teichoic acid export membrane protein
MRSNISSAVMKKMLPYFGASAVILAAMILGKAFSFVWRILILRYNVAFLGEIELFSTTLGLATTFATLAFPAALIRFSLRRKAKAWSYFSHAALCSLQALILVGGGVWLISQFIPLFTPNTQLPLALFLGLVLLITGQKLALAFLNSQKKFTLYGLGEYVIGPGLKLILLIGILLGIFQNNFLFPHVIWSMVLAAFVSIVWVLGQKAKQSVSLSQLEKKEFLSYSLFLSGSFLAFMVYSALDVYVLQYFFGLITVGLYAGMLTIVNLMDLLFLPFLHTFPVHLAERKTRLAKINFTNRTAGVLIKLGLISGLGIAGFGTVFIRLLTGSALNISIWILLAFAPYKILHYGVVHVYRHYLDFQGEQKFTAQTMFLSLGIKLFLCVVLVKPWGLVGLATANIVTDLFHIGWLIHRTNSRQ